MLTSTQTQYRATEVADWLQPELTESADAPRAVVALDTSRDIHVKIAATAAEWDDAFRLVARRYRARGYEKARGCEPPDAADLRFTPFHALPDTVTFVAKEEDHILATLSLVADNTLLGLPMEGLYGREIRRLRKEARRIVEVTNLADEQLGFREFTPVLTLLMQFVAQYGDDQGADTWVIAIHPRHRLFYERVLGFTTFGGRKAYPAVENHPAEAFLLDVPRLRQNSSLMYRKLFGDRLPPEALVPVRMPEHLVRRFSRRSRHADGATVSRILRHVAEHGSPRRWTQ